MECKAGTVTGFYSAVWALGILFPMLLLRIGKRELAFSGVNTTYSSGRGITTPGEKNSETYVTSAFTPFLLLCMTLSVNSVYVVTFFCLISHTTKPVLLILLLPSIIQS